MSRGYLLPGGALGGSITLERCPVGGPGSGAHRAPRRTSVSKAFCSASEGAAASPGLAAPFWLLSSRAPACAAVPRLASWEGCAGLPSRCATLFSELLQLLCGPAAALAVCLTVALLGSLRRACLAAAGTRHALL